LPQSYVMLREDFSTADAERPEMVTLNGELLVSFQDWRERRVVLKFPEAVLYRWEDDVTSPAGVRDDSSYEVIDSELIAELKTASTLPAEPHHYLLCFNAAGMLNVVSSRLVIAE
jgi:hypothetical protein